MSLLFALLKNARSKEMNRLMIGYEVEEIIGPITKEDVIAYAKATQDDLDKYKGDNPIAPPFFGSKLAYNQIKKIIAHNNLKMNILKMVHGQQDFIWHKNLHVGDTVKIKLTIRDIYDVPIGEMVELSAKAYVDNRLAVEAVTSFLVRGKRSKSSNSKENEFDGLKLGKKAFTLDIETKKGQQLEYAKASGDTNFIHTNGILAKAAGLPGTIMHGICILAMCNNSLANKCAKGDYSKLKQIKGRFSNVVLPGQKLKLIAYDTNKKNHYIFEVLNEKEKQVMKNGIFVHE